MTGMKERLAQAFRELIAHKSLRRITVNDIVTACGVSRMTFYYHFHDIYDLLAYICRDDMRRVLTEGGDVTGTREGTLRICHYMQDNKTSIDNLYHSLNRDQIEDFLYEVIAMAVRNQVLRESAGCDLEEVEVERLVDYHTYAKVGQMFQWVRHGMAEPPEALLDLTEDISRDGIRQTALRLSAQRRLA